jgi:D-amino-acid dehydrogenase
VAHTDYDVAIIGAGIVGVSAALYLSETGKRVALIDRRGLGLEASYGNAGALAFAEIAPLASPGIMRRALKWLVDPLGPLSVPPAYLPRLAPWLVRLWRASGAERHEAGIAAQASLMALARTEMGAMLARPGLECRVRSDGALELYEGVDEFRAALPDADRRQAYGIEIRHVQGEALADLQPGLAARFTHGSFIPGWQTVDDPHTLAVSIAHAALERGAVFLQREVAHVGVEAGRARITLDDGAELGASHAVIAAGAWSHRLTRQLGETIPLETERGYNTTLPRDAFDVRRQLTFPRHGFVITPLACGLRVGGAVEFGGLERPPNFKRSATMLRKAQAFLPGLKVAGGEQWMGFRPSLPDSLPVIGPSSRHAAFIYAFGHGHLGLTQSAATARLVRDMVLGAAPAIPLAPYRPGRFRGN